MEIRGWRGMNPCYTRYIRGSYFIYKSVYIEKKSYIIDIIIDIFLLIYNIWLFLYIEELDFSTTKTQPTQTTPHLFCFISLIGLVGFIWSR